MIHRDNVLRIKGVHNALGDLQKEVIFVRGATVSLYADMRINQVEVRPTDEVDILVELYAYKEYAELENRLRSRGFVNDQESGVICRYKVQGITVDVMPTDEKILRFSNKWYLEGYKQTITYDLEEACKIKILSPVYFIACKVEAFKNRGKNDGRTSTDFEDIMFVYGKKY